MSRTVEIFLLLIIIALAIPIAIKTYPYETLTQQLVHWGSVGIAAFSAGWATRAAYELITGK